MVLLVPGGSASDAPASGRAWLSLAADLLDEGSRGHVGARDVRPHRAHRRRPRRGGESRLPPSSAWRRWIGSSTTGLALVARNLHGAPNLAERRLPARAAAAARAAAPAAGPARPRSPIVPSRSCSISRIPYAQPGHGTAASLAGMTLDGGAPRTTRAMFQPEGATLVVGGRSAQPRAAGEKAAASSAAGGRSRRRRRSRGTADGWPRRARRRRGWRIVPRPGAAQSELRVGHVATSRAHAGLPRAGAVERGARRAVRQPPEHEPARGQGLHLRRAHRLRFAAGRRPVRAADERRQRRHRAGACARRFAS